MATKHYENGIVGTSDGGSTDIINDIFVTGDVFWVDSVNGSDSNPGTNFNAPKATVASAIGAASDNNGDLIILKANHYELVTTSITVNKAGIRIMGLGTGTNKPEFVSDQLIDTFDITADDVELINLYFPIGIKAANNARINIAADGVTIEDCDFYCGVFDLETITIAAAGTNATIQGCTFTITQDGPDAAIEIESALATGLKIIGCTFDGGAYDFDVAAIHSAVDHTEFLYRNNSLLNNASIIHSGISKGWCTGTVANDGSRVEV